MASDHFLDANILIGSLVEWDGQHRHTHRYMQQEGFRRHTTEGSTSAGLTVRDPGASLVGERD